MSGGVASRGTALALLALLAGCGAPEPPADRACDEAVYNDPAVKLLMMKGAGSEYLQAADQYKLRAAEQDARLACLRSRGLVPPGGVERQKPIT